MVLALALTACGGDLRTPTGLGGDGERPSGRASRPSPVVGSWRVTLIVSAGGDLQQWTTTWRFGSDKGCDFLRETLSLVEGIRRTVQRSCTYIDRGRSLEVQFDDATEPAIVPYEVPSFSNDRLIIEGVEYERIA